MESPNYLIKTRDILYISAKALKPDGVIIDLLANSLASSSISQGESGGYLMGYEVNKEGNIILPIIGPVMLANLNMEDARTLLQQKIDSVFKKATVEIKLLSFKFTVIGEVKSPGTYVNYNTFLTVLEAIGRAGGISDLGRRDRVLVIRPSETGTKTFRLNLQDKEILRSEAYFLLPNDVVIVEPQPQKVFNLNLPTFSFIMVSMTSLITTTLLLINYFK